jgi:FKBP-type peptidyl-prolyl cis-trans isomerase
MRSRPALLLLLLGGGALALAACDDVTRPTCGPLPTRVVEMRGDTAQTTSGLRYLDLAVGTGEEAVHCVAVSVGYVGRLQDGTVFDSGTFPFVPGTGTAIAGFEQAVIGMRVGGQRRAIIPPYLGYGAAGQGSIPPNATLIFDLELRSVAN